jgi:hypothetical protein
MPKPGESRSRSSVTYSDDSPAAKILPVFHVTSMESKGMEHDMTLPEIPGRRPT